ncbi:GAF and ANTAR domain-containing protein [uncultured Cellulomonas sp.]|uniref:GAF and ANTAR domain-containing protein n=1 Tax=uncultured Cellulomonas sp. TaxID=189682 RepID=UPI0028EC5F88|nr:GAF and ANTAR domain-containing protein [uncultured Cellulomonas sp.]
MSSKSAVLGRLATSLASSSPDQPFAARLCRACVEILGADGGAITLSSTKPERLTVSTSNGTSARIEDLQDVLGEGPGQDAFRAGHAVVTHVDGDQGGPFPMFTELAGRIAGPLTVWAIPMHPGGVTIGVVTLYRAEGELDESLDDAQFLADAVGAALLDDHDSNGVLAFAAWSDRARVHQATGMIVAQLAVSPEDALAILRAHAFADSATLDQIATQVVERRLSFTGTDQGVSRREASDDSSRNGDQ